MAEDYKRKVAKELYDLGPAWHDLSNAVSKLNSEQEVREFLWSARAAIQNRSNIPYKRLAERAPTFTDVIYGEMPGSKVDYDKTFGKDWYNNFADIDYGKVQNVAMKTGQDPKKLLHDMAEEATRRQRYDIAHGGIDDKIMTIVLPRATEAVEQGRSPEAAEVAMDVGQIGSYAVPYGGAIGRLASAIPKLAKFGKTVSAAKAIASNVAPPLINEGMDAAYYDEENPRGDFNWGDVASGTALNAVMPYTFKRTVGRGLQTFNISKRAGKMIEEFGEGATARDKASELLASAPKYVPEEQRLLGSSILRDMGDQSSQMFRTNPRAWGQINKNPKLYEIAAEDGKSLSEKYSKWLKRNNLPENTPIEQTLGWNTGNNQFISRDAVKLYDELGLKATEGLKTSKNIAREEAIKNLIINKVGDYGYEGDPWQRLPYVGSYIHRENLEDKAEEKKLKEADDLYKKWQKKIQEVYGE